MDQSDFAEKIEVDGLEIEYTFLMESGVRMILKDLKAVLNRGVQVRILAGDYLGITQPSALCLINFKKCTNFRNRLVPFHYYGIYDETDYSSLHLVKGCYKEMELNETYIGNVKRYDLIYKYYMKYRSKRALGFCCSRQHAKEMAKEFCKRGIESVAVYSNADGEFSKDRDKAIEKLKNQEIKVIYIKILNTLQKTHCCNGSS